MSARLGFVRVGRLLERASLTDLLPDKRVVQIFRQLLNFKVLANVVVLRWDATRSIVTRLSYPPRTSGGKFGTS